MKRLRIYTGLLFIFILGCILSLWYQSLSRMQDEYIYALDASNVLFMVSPEKESELSVKLNKILLGHLNRFSVARQYVPSVLVNEFEELFCGSFNRQSEGMHGFDNIASEKVQQYLEHATSYCQYEN